MRKVDCTASVLDLGEAGELRALSTVMVLKTCENLSPNSSLSDCMAFRTESASLPGIRMAISSPLSSPTGRGQQPLCQPSCRPRCHFPNDLPRCAEPRSQTSGKCLCRSSSCVHGAWSPCAACVSWLRAVLSQTSQGCLPRPHCKACGCRPSPLLKTACADEHIRRRHPKTTCVL